MIRYTPHLHLICHLFVAKHAEPLIGEKVRPADSDSFAFVASIGVEYPIVSSKREHLCAGSLVTKEHVITAAHCLESVAPIYVDVIVGKVDLTITSPRYSVSEWITYDNWALARGRPMEFPKNDVAIVTLETPVDGLGVEPVVLTNLNNERIYRIGAVIAGWGITNTGRHSDVLLSARVTILEPIQCSKNIGLITNLDIHFENCYLCSWANPYVLTGPGDSGGPVVDLNKKLLGVVLTISPNDTYQWGNFSLDFINQYTVNLHASVDYYRDFIENQTGLISTRHGVC